MSDILEVFELGLRASVKRPRTVITEVLRNPLWAVQAPYFLLKLSRFELEQSDFILHLLPEMNQSQVQAHLNEIYDLFKNRQRFFSDFQPPRGGSTSLGETAILYTAVRLIKPEKVIETGSGSGMSSTFILAGLEMNNRGHLYSIDLPKPQVVTEHSPNSRPGWLIPDSLRNRWTLVVGKSEERLLPLLEELDEIDLFFHDSLHYFRHQKFEYETALPFIKSGGLLLSHDINKPYLSLCRRFNATPIKFQGLGGIRKGSQR